MNDTMVRISILSFGRVHALMQLAEWRSVPC